jgi:hypothetical protein
MRFAELGLGVAIVNDFCSPPSGTAATAIGLPSMKYQLLRYAAVNRARSRHGTRGRHLLPAR